MTPKEYRAWAQEQIGPEYKVKKAGNHVGCATRKGKPCAFRGSICYCTPHGRLCAKHPIVFVKAKK